MLEFIKSITISQNLYIRLISITTILLITLFVNHIFKKFSKKYFEDSSKKTKVDPTSFFIFKRITSVVIIITGVSLSVYLIPELKAIAISLFAGAGVFALMIGFAAQTAFSNLVSGVFVAIFKPFRVGDIIKFREHIGEVEDITLRHTIINNFENKRFVIPNSKISEEIIENYHLNDEKTCKWIDISISYDSNIDNAISIMYSEIVKHPNLIDGRTKKEQNENSPLVKIKVLNLGEYSIDIRAWVWAKNPKNAFNMGCDLKKSIKEKFDEEGIEIPFPYRTIVMKEDLIKQANLKKSKIKAVKKAAKKIVKKSVKQSAKKALKKTIKKSSKKAVVKKSK